MVQDWTEATTTAVRDSLVNVISYIPNVIGALVVLLVGVIIAWAVKTVIVRGLSYIKLKKYTEAIGLSKVFTEKVEFVELLGDLAKWTIILVFLVPALEILNLTQVNELLSSILSYIPEVIKAIVALFIGVVVADLVSRVVRSTAATVGAKAANALADIAKWAIIVFVSLGALQQLNILPQLISTLTVGVMAFFVIAGGVAFGLGGRDAASDVIANVRKSFK